MLQEKSYAVFHGAFRLEAIFYIIAIIILTRRNPDLGPPGPRTSLKVKVRALLKTWEYTTAQPKIIGSGQLSGEEFAKQNNCLCCTPLLFWLIEVDQNTL